MIEKIYLDTLTQDSVSLRKQGVATIEDTEYEIGLPWRRAYVNSEQGRQQVQDEVPEPYSTAIFAVWGDAPTVIEPIE